MGTDPSAYWATVAALCPVLGFAAVLEMRSIAEHLATAPRVFRVAQGIVTVAACFALIQSLTHALIELSSASIDLTWAPFINLMISLVATVLILNPVVELAVRLNADTTIRRTANKYIAKTFGRQSERELRKKASKLLTDGLAKLEAAEAVQAQASKTAAASARAVTTPVEPLRAPELISTMEQWAAEMPPDVSAEDLRAVALGIEILAGEVVEERWNSLVAAAEASDEVKHSIAERHEAVDLLVTLALKEAVKPDWPWGEPEMPTREAAKRLLQSHDHRTPPADAEKPPA